MRVTTIRGAARAPAVLGLLMIACAAPRGHAQISSNWLIGLSGNWSDSANWTGPVPNNMDPDTFRAVVAMPGSGGPYVVSLDLDVTLDELALVSPDCTFRGEPGNTVNVLNDTLFSNVTLESIDAFNTGGTLTFNSTICDDICDTPIIHGGTIVDWSGTGDIRLLGTASFTNGATSNFRINNAQTLNGTAGTVFANQGTMTKAAPGITSILGSTFNNTGTVVVESGTLRIDGVDVNGNANTLSGGRWVINNATSLDLIGQQVVTNRADVSIRGTGAFDAVTNFIATNDTGGRLDIDTGATFTTIGDFTNSGQLRVGAGTTFRVNPGNTLLSAAGSTLSGGTYEVLGTLQYDGANIDTIDSNVVLDGPASEIVDQSGASAISLGLTISDNASFEIRNGRDLSTAGDVTVAPTGTLRVGSGSTFEVPAGSLVTNVVGGDFTDGIFEIEGTLRFPGAAISRIDNKLVLIGDGSTIQDLNGNDAISSLTLIDTSGSLTLDRGRDLQLASTLGLVGNLGLGSDNGNASILDVGGDLNQSAGNLNLTGGALNLTGTLNQTGGSLTGSGTINGAVVSGGLIAVGASPGALTIGSLTLLDSSAMEVEIGGYVPGEQYDLLDIIGDIMFGEGSGDRSGTLNVSVISGFVPQPGDAFDIVFWGSRDGEFARTIAPGFEVLYLPDRLRLVYLPAPSAGLLLALGVGIASRRRRGNERSR